MVELFADGGQAPKPVVPDVKAPALDRHGQNTLRRLSSPIARMSTRNRVLLLSIANKLAARE